jgi:beta-galactosidase
MLMEHAPGAVHDAASAVIRPLSAGGATAAAQTYLDRGATGIMYFQWRASPGGAEQWHPAMTQLLPELNALGAALADREVVRVQAATALLYDEEAGWAWQSPHLPTREIDYEATARRWHAALGGIVDVLAPGSTLRPYKMVVVPVLYLMAEATHTALRSYVAAGGTLVITFASGLVDECTRSTPGSLDDLIGAQVRRQVPLLPDETVALQWDGVGRRWIDEVLPTGARVLLRTADGRPVVTSHRFGTGEVRYVATDLDDPRPALDGFG